MFTIELRPPRELGREVLSRTWKTKRFGISGIRLAERSPPAPAMEGLTCPSDPPEVPGQPWLTYVGNAGWAFTDANPSVETAEYAANGIFFDDNKNTNIGPTDGREGHPRLQMSMARSIDGTTKTMMISENLHTFYWTYGLPTMTRTTRARSRTPSICSASFGRIRRRARSSGSTATSTTIKHRRPAGHHGSVCRTRPSTRATAIRRATIRAA